jgi:hypothetical protein
MLIKPIVKERLAFFRKCRHWTADQWRKVMFPDKSTSWIVNARGVKVWWPKAISQYKHSYTILTVKHSASVMVHCKSGQFKEYVL